MGFDVQLLRFRRGEWVSGDRDRLFEFLERRGLKTVESGFLCTEDGGQLHLDGNPCEFYISYNDEKLTAGVHHMSLMPEELELIFEVAVAGRFAINNPQRVEGAPSWLLVPGTSSEHMYLGVSNDGWENVDSGGALGAALRQGHAPTQD
ncbi:MAG: hypothetical protein GY926_17725 [bacterium]|nr:hypothetical protein [bacterium]